MDIGSIVTTMLSANTVKNISKTTGSDNDVVKSVLSAALPSLLTGASNNAKDSSTKDDFLKALISHSAGSSSVASILKKFDLSDGVKVLGHLLGTDVKETTKEVAKEAGTTQKEAKNIMGAGSEILMSLLGAETNAKESDTKGVASAMKGLTGSTATKLLKGLLTGDSGETKTTAKKSTSKSTTSKSKSTKKTTTAKKSEEESGNMLSSLIGLAGKLLK